ncbi:MAG: glycosyltransferase [Anaerolineales bacterium]
MRIAYVALQVEPKNIQGGVGEKISSQMGCWLDTGHSARLFALVPNYSAPDIYTYGPRTSLPVLREITRASSRSVSLGRLILDVRKYRPDIIYLRCGAYMFPLHSMFSIAPVVMELNSNDVAQRSLRGPYTYWSNVMTRSLMLRRVSGLVAVTREIAELPANSRFRKPFRVIGNGIDLHRYDPLPAPHNTSPVLTLVGSSGMVWHGVDKLIHLAEMCSDLKINIVGYEGGDLSHPLPANVMLHGFVDRLAIKSVLMKSDVACGSLALHRNGMQEGSTLKVREALAYGLPLILGYRDIDLMNFQNDCILELPNTEENVVSHAAQIRSFAYGMMGRRLPREAVTSLIDQQPKEQARLAFFDEVVKMGKHASA